MEVGLVSCTKSKRSESAKPADLYMKSALFEKARAYVEAHHEDWYILSAKYHLLDPNGPPIEPYDETLSGAPIDRRRKWAQTVYDQLDETGLLARDITLVLHAGKDYYDQLLPLLEDTSVNVEIPTEGLRFGETLAWYNEHL